MKLANTIWGGIVDHFSNIKVLWWNLTVLITKLCRWKQGWCSVFQVLDVIRCFAKWYFREFILPSKNMKILCSELFYISLYVIVVRFSRLFEMVVKNVLLLSSSSSLSTSSPPSLRPNLSRDTFPQGRCSLGKCPVPISDLFGMWTTLSNPDASDLSKRPES